MVERATAVEECRYGHYFISTACNDKRTVVKCCMQERNNWIILLTQIRVLQTSAQITC